MIRIEMLIWVGLILKPLVAIPLVAGYPALPAPHRDGLLMSGIERVQTRAESMIQALDAELQDVFFTSLSQRMANIQLTPLFS